MAKDLIFICCQPNDLTYVWQVNVWLESCKRYGYVDKTHILIYKPDAHVAWLNEWNIVQELYPEAQFFRYDDQGIKNLLYFYLSLSRPHTLQQHFAKYPELSNKAILYHDCDIMLNRPLDISKYIDDDINYVSDTVSKSDYMSHIYFRSKRKDVLPENYKEMPDEIKKVWDDKLVEYDKRNILAETAYIVGIEEELVVDNYANTGGAQYLLKNINARFWEDVQKHSLEIVMFLNTVNLQYFSSGDRGYQSWCADMWAVLWNLWAKGRETRQAPELSFCWATDVKSEILIHPILHNAGVTDSNVIRTMVKDENDTHKIVDAPAFYKGRYHHGEYTPFRDSEYVNNILSNPVSSTFCFHSYLEEVMFIKNKYNLTY